MVKVKIAGKRFLRAIIANGIAYTAAALISASEREPKYLLLSIVISPGLMGLAKYLREKWELDIGL